jgi:hypothetical protein
MNEEIPPETNNEKNPVWPVDPLITEQMEVHYHPQLDHKHKPWKEYLLEGLMIFIAVMMGFIAENIREGITNREHVQDLTAQLVQDLKYDTLLLMRTFQGESEIRAADDSLIELLQRPISSATTNRIQPLLIQAHSLWQFHPSAGAMAAIKNELHLNQFSSSKIIGLIAVYERHIELLNTVQDITLQYQRTYIDPFLLQHFTAASLQAGFNNPSRAIPEIRNLSREDLTQLGADMVLVSINTEELKRVNRMLLADAKDLIQYVKERYNPM